MSLIHSDSAEMKKEKIVSSIVNCLTKLKRVEYEQPHFYNCGEEVLEACYLAGKLNVEFRDEEQRKISSLVIETIKKIDNCIFRFGYSFDADRAPSALIHRSGLQFILDNFKSFPTGEGNTLEKTLGYFQETESLETFDEALQSWKEDTTAGWDSIDHKREDLERPVGVPETHTWWL